MSGEEAPRPPLTPAPGYVADHIGEEFPGLRLFWVTVPARRQPSPVALRHRLSDLSNRYRGATAIALRTQPMRCAVRSTVWSGSWPTRS